MRQSEVDIFLFVNPLSGSKQGVKLLELKEKTYQFELQQNIEFQKDENLKSSKKQISGEGTIVNTKIFNLIDDEEKREALGLIKTT